MYSLFQRDLSNAHLCMLNLLSTVNGLFGKLLILAYKEVILELVMTKCTPILLYGLECFQLGKADLHSLDFTFNHLCMKLFKTGNTDVVKLSGGILAYMVICLGRGADLHIAQLIPLPLTISCSRKSGNPEWFWFYLSCTSLSG